MKKRLSLDIFQLKCCGICKSHRIDDSKTNALGSGKTGDMSVYMGALCMVLLVETVRVYELVIKKWPREKIRLGWDAKEDLEEEEQ